MTTRPVRNIVDGGAGTTGYRPGSNGVGLFNGKPVSKEESWWWSEEESRLYENWAAVFGGIDNRYNNPYFDYYYTGQDISVKIEGLGETLPIFAFGYGIQQQKQPVYGFWSYTHDAVLRGTRIISGAFSLVAKEPHEFVKKIARAAEVRAMLAKRTSHLNSVYGIDDDEENINLYWRRNIDYNLEANQQHLFSVHPPFNFMIEYGIQITSAAATSPAHRAEDIRQMYKNEPPLHSNYNERLVSHITPELSNKILLENVELTSKTLEYNVDGDPVLETYTFIARDERMLIPKTHSQTAPVPIPLSPRVGGGGSPPLIQ